MNQRKIIGLGRSSLVISLPQEWVQLNELKRSDVVSLAVQRDRSLVIFPGTMKKELFREITLHINPDEKVDMIVRNIIACYLNGHSSIKLVSERVFSLDQFKAIRYISRILFLRIMESDAKKMHMITFVDESKASVISGVQRLHKIASSMCRDAFNALKNRDNAIAETVYSLDDEVDHHTFFLLRLVRKVCLDPALANQLDLDPVEALDLQSLVQRIEEIADNAANIAEQLIMIHERGMEISGPIMERILIAGNIAIDSYRESVESYFSKDISSYEHIVECQKKILKQDREIASWVFLSDKGGTFLGSTIGQIRESIKRIAEYALIIAEVAVTSHYKP